MTCPVCGEPMSELTTRRRPRKACSQKCAGQLLNRQRWEGHGAEDRAAEVSHLLGAGEAPWRIALRLGLKPKTLARSLERAQRHDLAAPFNRLDPRWHRSAS